MKSVRESVRSARDGVDTRTIGMFIAAVMFGFGLASLLSPDPVVLPAVGSVSGVVAGGVSLLFGVTIYTQLPDGSECGCSGDCGC